MRAITAFCVLLAAVSLSASRPAPLQAVQSAPRPNDEEFLATARANLERSARVQNQYAYRERRTELRLNPFGRLGTGAVLTYQVTPAADGSAVTRLLLERDGGPVADARPERQERRSRPQRRSAIEDAVSALRFTIDGRQQLEGRDTIIVRFEPKPDADPETREGRIAKMMHGLIWVDEAAREVMRAEATAMDDLSYGFGLIARLKTGTHVTLTRSPVDGDIWLPTSIRFRGEGRAMLFRKLTIDHVIEWFDYRRVIG